MNRVFGWAIAALLLAAPDALAQNAGRQFNVGTLNSTTYTNEFLFRHDFQIPRRVETAGGPEKEGIGGFRSKTARLKKRSAPRHSTCSRSLNTDRPSNPRPIS